MSADTEELDCDYSYLEKIRCPCCCSAKFTSTEKLRMHIEDVRRRLENLQCFACSQKLYSLLNYEDHLTSCNMVSLVSKQAVQFLEQERIAVRSMGLKLQKTENAATNSFKILSPTVIAPMMVVGKNGKRRMVQVLKTAEYSDASESKRQRNSENADPVTALEIPRKESTVDVVSNGNKQDNDDTHVGKPHCEEAETAPVADDVIKPSGNPTNHSDDAKVNRQDYSNSSLDFLQIPIENCDNQDMAYDNSGEPGVKDSISSDGADDTLCKLSLSQQNERTENEKLKTCKNVLPDSLEIINEDDDSGENEGLAFDHTEHPRGNSEPVCVKEEATQSSSPHISKVAEANTAAKTKRIVYKCSKCSFTTIHEKLQYAHRCSKAQAEAGEEGRIQLKPRKWRDVDALEKSLHMQLEKSDPLAEKAPCPVCKEDIHSSLIEIHTKIHTKCVPILYCDPCGGAFLSQESFLHHVEVEGDDHKKNGAEGNQIIKHECEVEALKIPFEKKFDCAFCEAKGRTLNNMKKHFTRVHKDLEKDLNETPDESDVCSWHCKICNENVYDASLHNKLHKSGMVVCKCLTCHQKFVTKHRLTMHMRTNSACSEKNQLVCPDCGLNFKYKSLMMNHALASGHASHLIEKVDVFDCSECDKRFLRTSDLQRHQVTHGIKLPSENLKDKNKTKRAFKCNICEQRFPSKSAVEVHAVARDHMMGYEYIEPLSCPVCQKQFARKKEFNSHVKKHAKNGIKTNQTECDICGKNCNTLMGLQRHNKSHFKFDCEKCSLRWATEKEMLDHMSVKHPDLGELIKCNYCTQYFIEKETFRLHNQSLNHIEALMNESAPLSTEHYFCEACEECVNIDLKDIHEVIHQRGVSKFFHCSGCSKKFCTAINLSIHVKTEHKVMGASLTFQCPVCPTVVDTPKELNSHHQSHLTSSTAVRHLKCTFCAKTFRNAGDRNKHELIHKGIKNFHCKLCTKSFRLQHMLALHMRTHTNERPYPCPECDMSFKSNSTLKNHLRSKHSDERTYACTYCPKTCKTRAALVGHMGIHERQFKCNDCGRTFHSRSAAIGHIKKIHLMKNRERFQCVICNAVYGRALFLAKHMKTHAMLNGRDDLLQQLLEVSGVSEAKDSDTPGVKTTKRRAAK